MVLMQNNIPARETFGAKIGLNRQPEQESFKEWAAPDPGIKRCFASPAFDSCMVLSDRCIHKAQ